MHMHMCMHMSMHMDMHMHVHMRMRMHMHACRDAARANVFKCVCVCISEAPSRPRRTKGTPCSSSAVLAAPAYRPRSSTTSAAASPSARCAWVAMTTARGIGDCGHAPERRRSRSSTPKRRGLSSSRGQRAAPSKRAGFWSAEGLLSIAYRRTRAAVYSLGHFGPCGEARLRHPQLAHVTHEALRAVERVAVADSLSLLLGEARVLHLLYYGRTYHGYTYHGYTYYGCTCHGYTYYGCTCYGCTYYGRTYHGCTCHG